jgi:hypothetical protein
LVWCHFLQSLFMLSAQPTQLVIKIKSRQEKTTGEVFYWA